MSELSPLELEVARHIIESVNLDDVRAEEISPDSPLFGEGLGLDSIDALEIALAIERKYDVPVRADVIDNRHIFASVRALSEYIDSRRTAA